MDSDSDDEDKVLLGSSDEDDTGGDHMEEGNVAASQPFMNGIVFGLRESMVDSVPSRWASCIHTLIHTGQPLCHSSYIWQRTRAVNLVSRWACACTGWLVRRSHGRHGISRRRPPPPTPAWSVEAGTPAPPRRKGGAGGFTFGSTKMKAPPTTASSAPASRFVQAAPASTVSHLAL